MGGGGGGGGGGRRVAWLLRAANWAENQYFKLKKNIQHTTDFKLLNRM